MSDWKFDVDEVGEDAEDAGTERTVEPGSPSLEGAVFVVLGVLATVFTFAHLAMVVLG